MANREEVIMDMTQEMVHISKGLMCMTKIDYYCRKCHTQLERFSVDEVKNAFRNYVIYANWCPGCERYIGYICEYGGQQNAPKEECIMTDINEVGDGAPNCGESEDGSVHWWCKHYIDEHMLSRAELEAGIV